jgi:hypothetical protein
LPTGEWYQESVAAVQAHRDELQAEEAKEWASKRKPILLKLSADLEKLATGRSMNNREFCNVHINFSISRTSLKNFFCSLSSRSGLLKPRVILSLACLT